MKTYSAVFSLAMLSLCLAGCGASESSLTKDEQAAFKGSNSKTARSPEFWEKMKEHDREFNATHKIPPGIGVRNGPKAGPPPGVAGRS